MNAVHPAEENSPSPALSIKPERLRLRFTPLAPLRLPSFSGSLLRGVFGHALRQIACSCGADIHQPDCRYNVIFEPPEAKDSKIAGLHTPPPAYVLTPPAPGEQQIHPGQTVSFDLTLLGPAVAEQGLILGAWRLALRRGLGLPAVPCELLGADSIPLNSVAGTEAIELVFTSPWHIKRRGKNLRPEDFTLRELLFALARRSTVVQQSWPLPFMVPASDELARLSEQLHSEINVKNVRWERYSNRQQKSMPLYGLMGSVRIWAPSPEKLDPILPLLTWGQWLHGGSKTALGLGGYLVQDAVNPSKAANAEH